MSLVRVTRVLGVVASLLALATGRVDAGETENAIAIVVGHASPLRDVTVDELRELYLRRQRVWTDGRMALPVNLPADNTVRRGFSQRVLGRTPDGLVGYWNQRYFDGVRPPAVLPSPRAVCNYVAAEPNAIGYMGAADVDAATCRALRVIQAAAE